MAGSRVITPHGDLQEAHRGFGFEIHDERRIEIDVARRKLFDLLLLRRPLASGLPPNTNHAPKPPPPSTSTAATMIDDQAFLAAG